MSDPARAPAVRAPIIGPGHTFESVTDKISAVVLTRRAPRGWFIAFGLAFTLAMVLLYATTYLFVVGIGIARSVSRDSSDLCEISSVDLGCRWEPKLRIPFLLKQFCV